MRFFFLSVYVRGGIFCESVLTVNIPPRENNVHMILIVEIDIFRENYTHVKSIINVFAKFTPSENNHFYSIYSTTPVGWLL